MTGPEPTESAWQDYLAAAGRLDAVRRGAAAAASEQAQAVQAAREELTGVRARLAPQHSRLRGLGVPDWELAPGPAELSAAAGTVAGGPGAVLAALRGARATADAADATAMGAVARPAVPAWLRNLLVYVPFAFVVLVIQVGLYRASGDRPPEFVALLCGLVMPAAAFGLGWLIVGFVFRAMPGARVERTPLVGAVLCAAPALVLLVWSVAARFGGSGSTG